MFGQPQQNTAFGGGIQSGGIFGKPAGQPQSSGFGGFMQPQQQQPTGSGFFGAPATQAIAPGTGLFGQPAQPTTFGNTSGFGQPQQQTQGGGLFGQSNPTQIAAQPQSTSGFFGNPIGMAQPQVSGFGAPAQNTGGFFGSQPTQPASGLFGQTQPQQQSGFQGQTGQTSTLFGTPAANAFGGIQAPPQQSKSIFFQNSFNQPAQPAQGLFGQQQNAVQTIYSEPQFYNPNLTSINKFYQTKAITTTDGPPQQLTFTNIRSEDEFSRTSIQMLRIFDLRQAKGGNQQNYEYLAMQEFNSNQQLYPLHQKLQQMMMDSTNKAGPKGQPQQTTLFGSQPQTSQFGAQSSFGTTSGFGNTPQFGTTSQFGQNQQPQNQWGGQNLAANPPMGGLFQNQSKGIQPATGGLFGTQNQSAQPKQSQFGSTLGQNTFGQPQAFQAQPQQTGLFGDQKPQGGGLFGQATPAPTAGGLFGQAPQPQTQTGGLFGQTQQPTGGLFGNQPTGLLGASQPQQQNQPTTGLFGAQNPPAGGLFGAKPATQPQININLGGLQQNPLQATGLFGQQPTQPAGGLFGATTQQTGQTSLFGNNQPKPATGLFGAQPAAQPTGGLFGNTSLFGSQPTQPAGGLFGAMPAQQQPFGQQLQGQQQQMMPTQQNYVDLYSSKDPLGLTNSFLNRDHPLENVQKEIELLKQQVNRDYPPPPADLTVSEDYSCIYRQPVVNVQVSYLPSSQNQYYQEEAERQRAKQDAKAKLLLQQQQNARREKVQIVPAKSQIFSNPDSFNQLVQRPNLSRQSFSPIQSQQERQTITITCIYNHKPNVAYSQVFEIHKSRDTIDIIKRVINWFKADFKFDGNDDEIIILYGDKQLEKDKTLKDIGLQQDVTLKVKLVEQQQDIQQSQLILENEVAPEELLPTPPKDGYKIKPSYDQLKSMTVKELEKVENFTISNEFGSIVWSGATDLTRVDLKDIVTIVQGSCEVYDDLKHKDTKPSVGQKLNKPAIITLTNIRPKGNQSATAKEQKLKENIEQGGDAEHLSYDHIKFVWQFKVLHFTKWCEKDDDMDEAAAPPVQNNQNQQESPIIQQQQNQVQIQENSSNQQQSSLFQYQHARVEEIDMSEDMSQVNKSNNQQFLFNTQQSIKRIHKAESQILKPAVVLQNSILIQSRIETQEIGEKNKILDAIKLNENNLKLSQVPVKRPSDEESQNFLRKFLNRDAIKTSQNRRGVCKPCFNPNGPGILSVNGNKISVNKIPTVKEFSIDQVLLQHLYSIANLSQQFSDIQLGEHDQEMAEPRRELFQDKFFRQMFNTELPKPKFFSSEQQTNDFLMDLAKQYASSQDNQLINEFQVVCMINALYGDPCRQLYSLRGKRIEFNDKSETLNEQSLVASKKRRNAVTEVLRLVCQMEYPVKTVIQGMPSEDQIYRIALQLLEVGDVRQCVLFLNQHKKTKLSLMVSQSVSNLTVMKQLQQSDLATGPQKSIIDFISGKAQPSPLWEKRLLYQLMFKQCPTIQLSEIIIDQASQNQQVQSLLWKLLATYAKIKHSDEHIQQMIGQLTPTHNPRDYRLRWIVQLVLRSAFLLKKDYENANQWACHIDDEIFTTLSSHYTNQLILQNDTKTALQVAMLIPQFEIRKRLLFEIMAKSSTTNSHNQYQELYNQLQVPQVFVNSTQALRLQNSSQSGKAVDMWLNCKADVHAQELYSQMVLPNSIKQEQNLNMLKMFYLPKNFQQNKEIYTKTLDTFITNIQKYYQSEVLWRSSICGLYQRVVTCQNKFALCESKNMTTNLYKEIQSIQNSIPQYRNLVTDWLRSETAEMMIAIRSKKSVHSTEVPITYGVTDDQGKRGCERILTKMLIDQRVSQ